MYDDEYVCMSCRSGQRCGKERRKIHIEIQGPEERRTGKHRRTKWPVLNEWCSVLQRDDNKSE